jgi:hypothetical protein
MRTTTTLSRLAAAGLAAALLLAAGSLSRETAPAYLVLLVGAVAAVGLLVAGRLWCRGCYGSRAAATLVATSVAAGQVLGASVGGPTGGDFRWGPAAAGVVALAIVTLLLLAVDSRAVRTPVADRPPYAL